MIYDVRLQTTYDYSAPVATARHLLRMTPINRPGQRVLQANIVIKPEPSLRREDRDFFGNAVTRVSFDTPHNELDIVMTARVEVLAEAPLDPEQTAPWERVRDIAFSGSDMSSEAPAHFLFPSRLVPRVPALRMYAAESFTPGRPILAAALDLTRRIWTDFTYDTDATAIDTPPEEVFALKRGVCQDFTHLMITGLRGLGIPAAYVSGFLRTMPPPGQERLEGADATHAWVAVWCGREIGWHGLDPTNGIMVGQDHIVLAIGRDYADVSPVDGVVVTAGDHVLDVAVDVVPAGTPISGKKPDKKKLAVSA